LSGKDAPIKSFLKAFFGMKDVLPYLQYSIPFAYSALTSAFFSAILYNAVSEGIGFLILFLKRETVLIQRILQDGTSS
jgi:hypothetical protein